MKLKTAIDVMQVAKDRGFQILINPGPPPMPYLKGHKEDATDPLVQALRAWRLEIIEEVQKQP